MKKDIFKIQLNQQLSYDLRYAINQEINISIKKPLRTKNRTQLLAWDRICAIMDRLDDTVEYLNGLELNSGKYKRSAFDFFDFMNNASVIIDCVNELGKIFDYDFSQINSECFIFDKRGADGKGSDKQYFEYLRSLCSVHPIETSRHQRYQENEFECSPFVVWVNDRFWEGEGDLHVRVYTSQRDEQIKRINIEVSKVFKYVDYRYNLISNIIEKIEEYQMSIIEKFKERYIKRVEEFDSYNEYLNNLINESMERFGDDSIQELQFVSSLTKLKLSNPNNSCLHNRYIEAFKYAIQFQHNALQNMCSEFYENTGIINCEANISTTLLSELRYPQSYSEEEIKYSYHIEKISYLDYESGDNNKNWVYTMLKAAAPYFEKYVTFVDAKSDFEHYALVRMALYQDCLENKCRLNKNIPNDLRYRQKLLSAGELRILHEPEIRESNNNIPFKNEFIIDDIPDEF
jgi:hypothetical protein